MVKIIGAIMTGLACGYFGFHFSHTLKTRAASLSDIASSFELLESEIFFSVNKLKKAFCRADRCGIFSAAAENTENYGTKKAWESAVKKKRTKLCLTDADCEILEILGKNLGKTDTDDQIKNIRYVKNLILQQKKQADEEYSRFGKIYRNGGILVGAMIVIILI